MDDRIVNAPIPNEDKINSVLTLIAATDLFRALIQGVMGHDISDKIDETDITTDSLFDTGMTVFQSYLKNQENKR